MRKRIFILTPESPDQPGGLEHFVRELVKHLEGRGYAVAVFHRQNCAPRRMRKPAGWMGRQLVGTLTGYFVGRAARRQLAEDVVALISNSTVGWYNPKGRQHPAKCLHFYHGTYRGQAEAIRPFISRLGYMKLQWWDSMVLERLSGRGKVCLTNSEQTSQEVKTFFGHDSVTTWLPVETTHFRPLDRAAARRTLGVTEDTPVGLFVGSTQPTKAFPIIQRLIKQFASIRWLLALQGKVPPAIADLPGAHVFHNASYAQLPLLYNAADFFVCPSRYEAFGYVVAEALACGTPVIASPGGASRAFLERSPFDRFLVANPEDLEAFASGIKEILGNPSGWRQRVVEHIRPRVVELLAPENWGRRFFDVAGL